MNSYYLFEAVDVLLKAMAGLTAIVGTNINYANGPIGNTWPQVHYFGVTETLGYLIDYDMQQVQISIWGLDKWDVLNSKEIIKAALIEYSGTVNLSGGKTIEINWSELSDAGALPSDNDLYGEFLRINFKYRGTNLEV